MGKILVVEPSLLDRARIRNVLEAAGHATVEKASPAEAVEALQTLPEGTIRLIMTELHFGNESGLDFIRWVREHETTKQLPVLVVTPQPPRETVIEMVKAGAFSIVTKPFGADMLLRRVTSALSEMAVARQGEGGSLSWQIDDFLRREMKRAQRINSPLAVLVCRVADQMNGQAVVALMSALSHLMRDSDVIAKLSDGEVLVLLPDTGAAGATMVRERIEQSVADLAEGRDSEMAMLLEVAIGSAVFPYDAEDGDALIFAARRSVAAAL